MYIQQHTTQQPEIILAGTTKPQQTGRYYVIWIYWSTMHAANFGDSFVIFLDM